uniref:Lipolysis-activating peptide 1-beta chain n=1 Tax=Buthus israelis TaxID=2899555 RepID=LV1B_BUTIS|nr:RecName: Full=Lipolysis-activating peptide 1-beta chain; Short=BoiLVP1-beta; Short=LVP1-beta; AltName: Full=Putative beta-like toxin Tx457; Flags: Precursor [Buthus occitanus israelis]ACJ23107.1 putative beta-like toxin Tx457 [Buthus occitanus israelis]
MANVQVIFVAYIAVIAFSMVYGDDYKPFGEHNSYYGCKKQTDEFCNKICKLHLAKKGGFCHQPAPFVELCKCLDIDYDNTYFLKAMEKQCPKLKGNVN